VKDERSGGWERPSLFVLERRGWEGWARGAAAEEGFLFVDEGAGGEVIGEGIAGGDGEFEVGGGVAEGRRAGRRG